MFWQAKASTGNVAELRQLLSSVQLVGSVFYSLNSPGLTDVRLKSCALRTLHFF